MKFQLTCLIDADLIGPLTELIAPYSRVTIKLVDGEAPPAKHIIPASLEQHRKRRFPQLLPAKGTGRIVVLRAVAKQSTLEEIKGALVAAGKAVNGTGASLSKLRIAGFVRREGEGVWRITPKGESALRKHEHVRTEAHEVIDESVGG